MTIDKAIKLMIQGSKYDYDGNAEDFCEAYDMAVEIMRKYKKITEIVKLWESDSWTDGLSYDCMIQISEVIEDGNND